MVKRCAHGVCNSDTRYLDNSDVKFYPIPKPKTRLEECKRWIKACGRPHFQLNVHNVSRHTFVCSKHFRDGQPTRDYPDPIPADGSAVVKCRTRRKRLAAAATVRAPVANVTWPPPNAVAQDQESVQLEMGRAVEDKVPDIFKLIVGRCNSSTMNDATIPTSTWLYEGASSQNNGEDNTTDVDSNCDVKIKREPTDVSWSDKPCSSVQSGSQQCCGIYQPVVEHGILSCAPDVFGYSGELCGSTNVNQELVYVSSCDGEVFMVYKVKEEPVDYAEIEGTPQITENSGAGTDIASRDMNYMESDVDVIKTNHFSHIIQEADFCASCIETDQNNAVMDTESAGNVCDSHNIKQDLETGDGENVPLEGETHSSSQFKIEIDVCKDERFDSTDDGQLSTLQEKEAVLENVPDTHDSPSQLDANSDLGTQQLDEASHDSTGSPLPLPPKGCDTCRASSTTGYKCEQREFNCVELRSLKQHMYTHTHTGEKPYKCQRCEFSSTRLGNLKQHMRAHTCKRPYKSKPRALFFRPVCHLQDHTYIHTGKRPYKCTQCAYRCISLSSLRCHKYTHTRERPYKCKQCTFSSTRLDRLKSHSCIHIGEMPHKCQQCEFSCARSRDLKKHMHTHSGKRPHKCQKCE